MVDIKAAIEQANKELTEERTKEVVKEIKAKLRQIRQAELVVRNLRRDLELLQAEAGDRA